MNSHSSVWEWIGAGSGIVAVVLIAVGFGLAENVRDTLDTSSPAAEIAKFYADRSDQAEAAGFIVLFGLLSFFWFLAYLRRNLQAAEGEGGWLTSVAYGGGLVWIGVMLGATAILLATRSISVADTQVAKTLLFLEWRYIWLFSPPLIAMTLATSVVAIRFRALPRWLGWVGVAVAITLLVPWIGILFFMAWMVVTSVVFLLKTTNLQKYVR